MADSLLDYIAAFTTRIHTVATSSTYDITPYIDDIVDATEQKILVYPGEYLGSFGDYYTTRHLVKISETSAVNLKTALNNIQIGIGKLNRREAITSYTRETTLIYCKFAYTNKPFKITSGKWYIDLYLDFTWTTS